MVAAIVLLSLMPVAILSLHQTHLALFESADDRRGPLKSSIRGRRTCSRHEGIERWPGRSTTACFQNATSFDHLVGAGEERGRQLNSKRLCGLQVDH